MCNTNRSRDVIHVLYMCNINISKYQTSTGYHVFALLDDQILLSQLTV